MALSRANPSAGWVAGVIGVHPWQLALFDERAQEAMWADDPATMHSSSYNPTGKAEKVDGGYRVSGRWSFSSGCDHCHGVNLGAIVRGGDGPRLPVVPAAARPVPRSRTTGTSPASRPPAARTSSSRRPSSPSTSPSRTSTTRWAPRCPGQERNDGVALPAAVVGGVQHGARRVDPRVGRRVPRRVDRRVEGPGADRRRAHGRRRAEPAAPRRRAVGPRRRRHRDAATWPRRCGPWPRHARPRPWLSGRACGGT